MIYSPLKKTLEIFLLFFFLPFIWYWQIYSSKKFIFNAFIKLCFLIEVREFSVHTRRTLREAHRVSFTAHRWVLTIYSFALSPQSYSSWKTQELPAGCHREWPVSNAFRPPLCSLFLFLPLPCPPCPPPIPSPIHTLSCRNWSRHILLAPNCIDFIRIQDIEAARRAFTFGNSTDQPFQCILRTILVSKSKLKNQKTKEKPNNKTKLCFSGLGISYALYHLILIV